jgi:hypothetical protein
MNRARILFASSGVGLGHITRDIYLARHMDWAEITWLTSGLAVKYLKHQNLPIEDASYELHGLDGYIAAMFKDGTYTAGYRELKGIYTAINRNALYIRDNLDLEKYDLIVMDEFWELLLLDVKYKGVFITDFINFKPKKYSILQRIVTYYINKKLRKRLCDLELLIYVGFNPNEAGGFEYYGQLYTHDTYIGEASDSDYILINIGGTSIVNEQMKAIERELIKLGFEVVFIGGEGHFYAYPLTYIANAKAIITLGGYSSLIELARFRKRGIIIPLGEHFEQEDNARLFMGRSGYRVLPINKIDIYSVERYLEEIIVEDPDPPRFKDAAKIISSRIQGLMR